MDASAWRSGKTHRDENFPVARLVRPIFREPILAFYDYVRAADDIADHAALSPDDKLRALDAMERSLLGPQESEPTAVRLRRVLDSRGLGARHALDLVSAFRLDVTKNRYEDWQELMDYCALSAMPVGRFVLEVHGEAPATWAASDPLCAALQIINHLQDCGQDYRRLNRVYVPLDAFERAGARIEELGAARASPALRACLAEVAGRTRALVDRGAALPALIADWRLGVECSVIHALAAKLTGFLMSRDPLSQPVHLSRVGAAPIALRAAASGAFARLGRLPSRAVVRKGGA